jgi:hypothetical protein
LLKPCKLLENDIELEDLYSYLTKFLTNPGDEFLFNVFDTEVNMGGNLGKNQLEILKPISVNRVPDRNGADKWMKLFRLYSPEPKLFEVIRTKQQTANNDRSKELSKSQKMAYLSREGGPLLLSRHPVYISSKD